MGICRANCYKTHNELTLYPLGKCPFAPSDRGFFHKMPIGHIGGYFVKEPWVFTSKIPFGYLGGHFASEIREFAQKIPTGYLAGLFVKVIGGCYVFRLRNPSSTAKSLAQGHKTPKT